MKWESLTYLVELHAGGYLPISRTSQLGKQVRKLERIVRRNPGIDETTAARKIGIPPGGSQYRKVKYQFKLALLNGLTWVEKAHGARLKSRRDVVRQAWTGIGAARCGGAAVSEAVGHLAKRHFQRPLEGHHLFVEEAIISGMIAEHAPLRGLSSGRVRRKVDTALEQLDRMEMYLACTEAFHHSAFLMRNESEPTAVITYLDGAFRNELAGLNQAESYLLQFYNRYLRLRRMLAADQIDEAIIHCKASISYFEYYRSIVLGKQIFETFLNYLGRIYLEKNRIREAVEYLRQLPVTEEYSSATRSIRAELAICISLRAGNYELAYEAFSKFCRINELEATTRDHDETSSIYSSYFDLLSSLGRLRSGSKAGRLRIAKLLNSTPLSNQEKDRRNIHLIILRCLKMIRQKDERCLDYGDALRKYAYRHLRNENTIRQLALIKLLATVFDASYSRRFISSKSKKYLNQLSENPPGKYKEHVQSELIPYEVVWSLALECCDD